MPVNGVEEFMPRTVLREVPGAFDLGAAHANDPLFNSSAARAIAVMSAFHGRSGPMTLSEIARAACIDRSAAQRLVHTLRVLGHVKRSEDGRGFLPDLRMLDHAHDCLRLDPVVQRATPVLLELRRNVLERVDLSLFDDRRVVYATRIQSKRETFFATLVGHAVPTFCSSGGRAILAALPEVEARDIIERSDRSPITPKTETAPDAIMVKVAEAQRLGYALVCEEILVGEIAIGTAIRNAEGRPVGAVHVAGSLSEWTPEAFTAHVAPLAAEAASAISR